MKQYYFVMPADGPKRARTTNTDFMDKLQDGHMANVSWLTKAGKLLEAGPFGDDADQLGHLHIRV